MNDDRAGVFILILVVVLIVILVLIFIFKDKVFNKGSKLASKSNDELSSKGYGTYGAPFETPCVTGDGKCASAGFKYVTQYCEPNTKTGKGCLDENGQVTFAAKTQKSACQPNCRSLILQELNNPDTICNYDFPYNLPAYNCITSNARSFYYSERVCVANDPIGENACTYRCGSAGIDSTGQFGDSDPTKISYIPVCQGNSKKTITLNSLPWNTINNLPSKGVTMSKGYLIKNNYVNNVLDTQNFVISPAYPPWDPENASNLISYEDLYALDNTLNIYTNCAISPIYEKQLCDDYYYFKPTFDLSDDYTRNPNPSYCKMDSSFTPLKDCFYNPWYSPIGQYNGVTGLDFVNPYTGNTGYAPGSERKYSWQGIGNFGYIYSGLSCLENSDPLTDKLGATGYKIPIGSTGGSVCLNLNAPPGLCASSLTDIFNVPPNLNLSQIIKAYEGNTGYRIAPLQSYPQTPGTTNYICITEFPDGYIETDPQKNNVPGCIQTCRYMPTQDEINLQYPDSNGNYLNPVYWDLLGTYLNFIYYTNTGNYFLTTQNTPCSQGEQSAYNIMLGNCNGKAPYDATPVIFVDYGGDGVASGQYWSKNDCDAEAIRLTTAMQVLVSPYQVLPNSFDGSYNLQVDLYAYVAGYYGYLSPSVSSTSVDMNSINDLANQFNNNNVIANNATSGSGLSFNALPLGTPIPRDNNNSEPYFIINYNTSTQVYTLYPSQSASYLAIDSFNGLDSPLLAQQLLSFTTEANKTFGLSYYIKEGLYEDNIVKTEGIYQNQNVTKSINMQRQNPCYSQNLCQVNNSSQKCFPNTCNLFYEYNPEFCN